ncbi:MAG: hypothetical protein CMB80_29735 [Flammeovirgaceae bacterium]|nr:hypothetical protein [Flammeovirgaceae bacterium]MBE61609.1 hypothetical protein [Flammeovirgaceae bacterium]MBR10241.1 hypothetical protein [Rickettsiales bacterium]HCX22856.1 hypothetical protein [Cytophagales bacterium]|tara:strand:- start:288 stop:911 length:624 start_codon:yes stop_codon:yes gene_type:complete
MKQLTLILFLPIILWNCTSRKVDKEQPVRKGLTEAEKKANLDEVKSFNLITVEIGATREQMQVSQEHLYGKFFDERAEFYIVEKPELYVSDALVNRLTLYFIDGTLCKKKYELDTDISQELMKSYGGFRFKALNDTTYKLSREEKIVIKSDTGNVINDAFNRYQMRWEDDGVAIKYMVFKDTIAGQLELVEELLAYKELLRAAELDI